MNEDPVLLSVNGLSVIYHLGRKRSLRAVDNVSFEVRAGEIVGLVGESGSGKSTLAGAILRVTPAEADAVMLDGVDLFALDRKELRRCRTDMQLVFQDPLDSLNPRMTAGDIIAEPLRCLYPELDQATIARKVRETIDIVGLPTNTVNRYPHTFSGGQRQRIAIARAVITRPKLLFCDEAVSALDVSIQAQIINLLKSLRREFGMAIVFISHDMAVIRHICERVMVMYYGRIVENAPRDTLFDNPIHPYTKDLIASVPRMSRKNLLIRATPQRTNQMRQTEGCAYAPRCAESIEKCGQMVPPLRPCTKNHSTACWRAEAVPV